MALRLDIEIKICHPDYTNQILDTYLNFIISYEMFHPIFGATMPVESKISLVKQSLPQH